MKEMNVLEFREFLKERFGLEIPTWIELARDKGSAIRAYSKDLGKAEIGGYKGVVIYSKKTGIHGDFIQLIGKGSKNNFKLDMNESRKFASGMEISKKLITKRGPVILFNDLGILGIGTYEAGKIFPKIGEKRRRKIE